jgi:hypothetical protein
MHLGVFHRGVMERFGNMLNLSPQAQKIAIPVLTVGGVLLVWNWFRKG